jgi:CubicO group peptidase (beta-lactamase class C family)
MQLNLDHLQYAARVADEAVKNGPQPTAVLAVANRDETLWTHVSPGEDGVALDSIYQIASITKTFVATAIMRLVEEGKLALNLPVATYLPEFGANGKERMTAWHLLTHSSGLEEARLMAELQTLALSGGPLTPGYFYEACCRANLDFEPGTAHKYNSLAFSVLGELITRLSGEPYPQYLHNHIFEPLGMRDTDFAPADRNRAAPLHDFHPARLLDAFNTFAIAGGGLWSTAADLVAFGQTYLRGGTSAGGYKLITLPSILLMTQHYTPGVKQFQSEERLNYGLGWRKPSSPRDGDFLASERSFGHYGTSGTALWIDPEYGFIFVFLSNRWDIVDPYATRARCLNVVYGALDA